MYIGGTNYKYENFETHPMLKQVVFFILLLSACTSFYDEKEKPMLPLENKTKANFKSGLLTLELSFDPQRSTPARWYESKYKRDSVNRVYLWLEPENTLLINADTLYNGSIPLDIQVTGEIFNANSYPAGSNVEKLRLDQNALVFKYSTIKVKKNRN